MDAVNPIPVQWKKEQKVFEKNLAILRQKLNKEAIHDLRVAIKKLRAYFELYLLLKKKEDLASVSLDESLHSTEELFNTTGRQRDVEICLEIITELKKNPAISINQLSLYLQAILKITKAWTNQEIHRYKNKELRKIAFLFKQELEFSISIELEQMIKRAIDEKIGMIRTYFKKPHLMRKNLKSVYYWLNLINQSEKYQPPLLHSILDDLGSWQDHDVLLVKMKHFRKDYLPKSFDEHAVLKELEKNILEKKSNLLRSAINKTRKWLKAIATV
ncbi:MAG: CHAD domain-containing protein [Chitinophagaceae bacterium]|nr:CHAD domain-containing protein [Chitinophagaceae bacterium]